jgi:hypothetical protein
VVRVFGIEIEKRVRWVVFLLKAFDKPRPRAAEGKTRRLLIAAEISDDNLLLVGWRELVALRQRVGVLKRKNPRP